MYLDACHIIYNIIDTSDAIPVTDLDFLVEMLPLGPDATSTTFQ